MKIIGKNDIEPKVVSADGQGNPAVGTSIQVLTPEAPNFVMRLFTLTPGGSTPLHAHPWEHEVFVVSGAGKTGGDREVAVGPGDAVYVAPNETHCFVNTGDGDMKFICVVPKGAR